MTDLDLYRLIDHTQLREDASAADIEAACHITRIYGCASVCVRPEWVSSAAQELNGVTRLDGTQFGITTVVDFPYGKSTAMEKADEMLRAIADGATEIDLVMDYEAAQRGDWTRVQVGIEAVRDACMGATLKIIIESAALSDREIFRACAIAVDSGANYVKTSTGFHPAGGANVEAVAHMAASVPNGIGVKASGGRRTRDDSLRMVSAGATRIGTSATETLAQDSSSSVAVGY